MKDYINLFHSIFSEIHFWDNLDKNEKKIKLSLFLENFEKNEYLIDYFDDFNKDLSKKNLNYFLKSVSNPLIMAVPKRKQTPFKNWYEKS